MNENLQIEKTIVFRLFVLILKIKMLMKTIIARFHIFLQSKITCYLLKLTSITTSLFVYINFILKKGVVIKSVFTFAPF